MCSVQLLFAIVDLAYIFLDLLLLLSCKWARVKEFWR
jgi:hypothetical protein